MADLNIKAFLTTKTQEFLRQFDTNGNDVIEEANGEYAEFTKALNGGKAEKLGNTDSVSFSKQVPAEQEVMPKNESIDWDGIVDTYNKADYTTRRDIRNNTRDYVSDKLSTVSANIDNTIMDALTYAQTVDNGMMYRDGGSIESGVKSFLNMVERCFEEQYEEVRKSLSYSIGQYDARYARNPMIEGVPVVYTKDTEIIGGCAKFLLTINKEDYVKRICDARSDAARNAIAEEFKAEAYAQYSQAVLDLMQAANNITKELYKNQKETMKSIDEVTKNGNLTHEIGFVFNLAGGRVDGDIFNISQEDPITYKKFLNEVATYGLATDISSPEADNAEEKQSTVYDMSGRPVTGELRKGQVYIKDGKKFLVR